MYQLDGRSRLLSFLATVVLLTATSSAAAEELVGWPKRIDVAHAKVLIYQSRIVTDFETRMVEFDPIRMERVRRNDDSWQKRDDKSWSNAVLPADRGGGGRRR